MARDPFAPVQQSSVPQFVWIIVGVVGLLVVGVGTTMAIVISKRQPPVAAVPATPVAQPTPGTTSPTAADTKVATNDAQPAGGATSDSKPDKADKADKGDKPEKKHHKSSSSSSSKSAKSDSKPAGPSSPPPPPKKQNNMSQKEIDKLLGI